jgi:excinuclease ABC subunit C
LAILPSSPGVYLFKGGGGDVLYVGKAASLRDRVRSYFGSPVSLTRKIRRMMAQVEEVEYFLTDSEQEAFLLESSLIKKYRPWFNVRLKDDKSYPFVKVATGDPWPWVCSTRRLPKDGSRYFGPFANAGSVKRTIKVLRKLFPLRNCNNPLRGDADRPCLEYHLHRCVGPCVGAVTEEEYRRLVEQVLLFLEGKRDLVVRQLRSQMELAAEATDFEKAALLRDQIGAVEAVTEHQKIAAVEGEMDVVALASTEDEACMQVFFLRNGNLVEKEGFVLGGTQDETPSQIMTSFLFQFYESVPDVPPLILLQHPVNDAKAAEEWLSSRRGGRVRLRVPQRGRKRELVDMVAENARHEIARRRVGRVADPESAGRALEELQRALDLPRLPRRVEGYDISNIQGVSAVGSMAVFEEGMPAKSRYRRFKIRAVKGADDYGMLREVLGRRFARVTGVDVWDLPDLVLVDGGKGQLKAALSVMQALRVDSIPVASIAKEREEIFVPNRHDPILLPRDSVALFLVQRIRDEAHRFAIAYHRRAHRRKSLSSVLDDIPGIGAKRRVALVKAFGSMRALRKAKPEEIAAVKGLTLPLSQRVKQHLEE